MNQVNIPDRIVKNPTSPSGNASVKLLVATDRVKLKDGKTSVDEDTGYTAKSTELHWITCFNGQGKSALSRKKGDAVAIAGYLHNSQWEMLTTVRATAPKSSPVTSPFSDQTMHLRGETSTVLIDLG
ncbi:single-stranded DNA-binding protein [Sphingomonas sp. BIUV-7]|uniref:Single-stranded DNA-binding protein n=1 Tax=Sphingomonas natans TaxID=3063330 RepID=A0ABT8Y7X5_9SPHN|nr:single-stranded DNA-binding protein [Sphingomonas sp. BIUV-7]MDO6414422.1 single-stranded DNA-binding protein [Sphingomonas sp. BIUV-7]